MGSHFHYSDNDNSIILICGVIISTQNNFIVFNSYLQYNEISWIFPLYIFT